VELLTHPSLEWINHEVETKALQYAATDLIPKHLTEVKQQRLSLITKTEAAVKDRLTKEIIHWDSRVAELRDKEAAGKSRNRLTALDAQRRSDELYNRLQSRMAELQQERQISAATPRIHGGAIIIPIGLLHQIDPLLAPIKQSEVDTQAAGAKAREIVMAAERKLGCQPVDREFERIGYDIESYDPKTGKLRFIEVKGRAADASTVTVTRNEVLTGLNKPEEFILAIVKFTSFKDHTLHYIRKPFTSEPDFTVTSINYDLASLLKIATSPQ
jgi:hypothetical protein